eukprot:TRINITY_DN525_c2_g1_i1.p1 TRINITY_DN525_c2_g1~~TRINITY_DN525_c2_g1_i1.p1  ORF type:complete len:367 (-),score=116.88 TRINITY_DN525_c2_g1_i1:221-1321(-)
MSPPFTPILLLLLFVVVSSFTHSSSASSSSSSSSSCSSMKAVLLKEYGDVDNFYIGDTEKPPCDSTSLLVKVKATAINRADILQRKGKYPPPPGASEILGLEMAGVVEEIGSEVEGFQIGDRVMALLPGGGYASYVSIPAKMAMPVPDSLKMEEAAALPEAFLTAFQTLFLVGEVSENKSVLIHAGASGVGTSAIQLLNLVEGVKTYVTVGSAEKIDRCVSLGAHGGLNRKDGPWKEPLLKLTEGGVDLILDPVGKNYFPDDLAVLNKDGTLVMIGFLSGSELEGGLNLRPILGKRLTVRGSTLRTRSVEYKIDLTQKFLAFALTALKNGDIVPLVDKVFPWEKIGEAHTYMAENKNIGKIVITGM